MPRDQMGFTRVLLYQLKRYYGAVADVYFEPSDTVDLDTGGRVVTQQKWRIRQAICLPGSRAAMQILPTALKPIWQRGASVEENDKVMIVDRRDLPALGTHNWHVVIDHQRYEVLQVDEYASAFVATLKELAGVRVYEQVDATLRDEVRGGSQLD